jgi:hypothetical protein
MTSFLAAAAPSAGGAAIDEIIIATGAATLLTMLLLYLGLGHRSGRVKILARLSVFSERVGGLPGWAGIPAAVAAVSLIGAQFGFLWDVSIHIADGRDEGPLANPSHYFILGGLFGIFSAGFLAMVLPKGRPSASAIRITDDWHAPLGGVLLTAAAGFALIGFPLDDVWHRLFGQDVTLWGPTHLMLIGGAALTLIGIAVLLVEATRASAAGQGPSGGGRSWTKWVVAVSMPGAFLLGLSVFQGEFDFGVPQFRFVFQPMLIMVAAGAALVAARVWIGRGAAIGAALFFLAIRGIVELLVDPVLGQPTVHFPLYLGSALLVELAGLRYGSKRPVALAATSGLLVGTIGLASEWGWSYVFMATPWPAELLPEAAILGLAMALAGAGIGAWMGERLASDRLPRTRSVRNAGAAGAAVVAALVGYGLIMPAQEGVRATVTLSQASPAPERTVNATVRIDPPSAARDADWLETLAWQGGGLRKAELEQVGPGVYRTTEALPVYGEWKSVIRLHKGSSLIATPVFMPADAAIPAPEVPASPRFERAFISDHELLQRERKDDVPGWLWPAAIGIVLAIALAILSLVAWGLHRLALAAGRDPAESPPPRAARAAPGPKPTPRVGVEA